MNYIFFFRFRRGINWIKVAHVFLLLIICTVSFRSKRKLEEENTNVHVVVYRSDWARDDNFI